MIKLVAFFALLLAAAFGFAQVADQPGQVLVQVGETEIRLSLLTALAGLLAGTLAILLLWTLLRLVFRLPSLIGLATRMRRRARGQSAIARGLVAVGVGDARQAQRFAGESQRLLGREPLTLLLQAQAAQLEGNPKAAENAFRAMLEDSETRGLGLKGLYAEAEKRGDRAAGRRFAEEAYRENPANPWAQSAMLGFLASEQDWAGALRVLDDGISRRIVDRTSGARQRAALLTAAALAQRDQAPDDSLRLAQEALRADASLVPAATLVAHRHSARGDYAKATRLLETAWRASPHPDLAEAYLHARPGDAALDRLKRARALRKLAPDARESRFAVAVAAIEAREFGEAREALESLALERPTARACRMMAELEESENGNPGLVRAWLARASRAPRDPAWVADGVVAEEWAPVSPVTGRIGAFEWRDPPQAAENALRARIEADRFEAALIEAPDAEAAAPAESLPEAAEAEPAAELPVPTADEPAVPRPIVPDDPGPDPDAPPSRKRFSLFG